MTNDYATKEKAFLESLKADTGHDLAEWMEKIRAQNLVHRNDIIDWLRQQGFIFSRASWLERIHHNAGNPIYLSELPPNQVPDAPTRRASLRLVSSNPDLPAANNRAQSHRGSTISPVPGSPASKSVTRLHPRTQSRKPQLQTAQAPPNVSATVNKAKAFAPLARHLLSELTAIIPNASTEPLRNHLEFSNPQVFCALVMTPKGLRLCLDLGEREYCDNILKTHAPGPRTKLPDNLTHMIILEDARQIDDALLVLINSANQQVNG